MSACRHRPGVSRLQREEQLPRWQPTPTRVDCGPFLAPRSRVGRCLRGGAWPARRSSDQRSRTTIKNTLLVVRIDTSSSSCTQCAAAVPPPRSISSWKSASTRASRPTCSGSYPSRPSAGRRASSRCLSRTRATGATRGSRAPSSGRAQTSCSTRPSGASKSWASSLRGCSSIRRTSPSASAARLPSRRRAAAAARRLPQPAR